MNRDLLLRKSVSRHSSRTIAPTLALALLAAFSAEAAMPILVNYDLANAEAGNAAELAPATVAAGLNGSSITRGPGLFTSTQWDWWRAFSAVGWTTASSREADDYFQFQVTVQSGYQATFSTLTYGLYRQNDDGGEHYRGPADWDLLYSLDGFTTPGTVLRSGDGPALGAYNTLHQLTVVADNLGNIGTVTAGGTVTFRLYGYGRLGDSAEAGGGLGNGVDGSWAAWPYKWSGNGADVTLTGTLTAVPEPACFTLIGGLGLVLFGVHRRLRANK
jgi:hypothetical protein